MGMEFNTEDFRDIKKRREQEQERKLIESTFGTNKEMEIDYEKVEMLCRFGYPETYIVSSLQDSTPNYVTAGYYLLKMDQNYI